MKTGIHYAFGYPIKNQRRLELIKEAGFDTILLWWGDEYQDYDVDRSLIPDMARTVDLEVENIHAPFQGANLIWTDNIESEDIVKRYTQCIMDCSQHNIPTVVIHLTGGDNPPPPTQLGLDRIKYLVDLAEQKEVNIALENLRKPAYLQHVYANVQSNRLGFCYDSGHENCHSKGEDFLNTYGSKLIALHLHDNDGTEDQHRIPGEGTIDWDNVVRKIKSLSYSGAITLEVTHELSKLYSGLSAQEFLMAAHKKITELFL